MAKVPFGLLRPNGTPPEGNVIRCFSLRDDGGEWHLGTIQGPAVGCPEQGEINSPALSFPGCLGEPGFGIVASSMGKTIMANQTHSPSCACCLPAGFPWGGISRRGVLAGLAAAPFLIPGAVRASDGAVFDSMLLGCIDPRMVTPMGDYMFGRGLRGKFSQFIMAGAAVGVVAPQFASWQPAFWDNLATSIKLHSISRLIVIDHRDCGAAKIAYGDAAVATKAAETDTHKKAASAFRAEMTKRQPKMKLEIGLMALDGTIEMFV